jgi:6-phosphogluconolactonase (cycloisomerase 2 family)
MYTVDASSGALQSTNPVFVSAPPNPLAIAADPLGRFVYVAENGCCALTLPPGITPAIAMFTVDSKTGLLTPTTPATVPCGSSCGAVVVDPTGRFVYATDPGNSIVLEYAITMPSGVLTPIGSVNAGPNLNSIALAVEPSRTFLYVTSLTQGIFMFSIDPATGLLTPTNPPRVLADVQPAMTAVDPTGKFAYTANNGAPVQNSVVSMYTIDSSTGVLNSNGTVQAGAVPNFITVDPSGRFVYVNNLNTTLLYSIAGSTGVLSPLGSAGSGSASTLTFDPSGNIAYALTPGSVLTFTADSSTGVLSPAKSVTGPSSGVAIAVIGTSP